MTQISPSNKAIARAASTAFGGKPMARRYWDDGRSASVDIVSCDDSPWPGVTSFATIGVSDTPLIEDGNELAVRTELVGAIGSRFIDFPKYLSTAAFCVINTGWFVAPGIIFPNVLSMYEASDTMKHLLFLPPFLWDNRLRTLDVGSWKVAWLLAIPISQAEMDFALSHGVPTLEEHFEEHQIDIFDLNRASVL